MKKKSLIGVVLLGLSLQSYSIDLDLESAMNMAIQGNPDMRVKKLEIEKNELGETIAKKALLPNIGVSLGYDFIEDEDSKSVSTSIPIYTGGVLTNNIKLAKLNNKVGLSELEILKLDIREQVISKYFQILNLQKRLEIGGIVIETLEKQKQRLESLFNGIKLIPKSELLKVESDLLAAQASKFRDEKAMEIATYDMKILLGIDISEELILREFKYENIDVDSYDLESDIMIALANGNRADIEKLRMEIAERELDIARADFKPTVSLSASYNLDGYDLSGYEKVSDDEWRVSLSASWELFSWGSSIDNMNRSKKSLKQANIEMNKGLDQLSVEIRGRYNEMQTLYMEAETEEKKLDMSKENLRIDTMRYDSGMISSLDYLDSVNRLKDSEEMFYLLQRQLVLARVEYENLLK
ncbi:MULTISPECIES: TolC family protein [Psychrilyobacter]|uniref:TolC family protein n=1 Tax=Psychrilyobacter piezotolerans TaxID=2293438 RepID=A0ABX9KHP2_9FUSO|nr:MULTISPECIES: TolC family protein [Psychrilyobacter]MCS5420934.1 TolC family protein [Psychrilyobacter sp. S5]NDI77659.1 TolC family protein [Psychrilyobacter piezotolerans]RDE62667.1 TolC family protein [Psychrilyobacter sp. S5]REI41597.1 TolC family protein [Psychrilyobacter piezotolerans]